MRTAPTDEEKLHRLPWLFALSLGNTIFAVLTIPGSTFPLFLDALGLDKRQIGGVLSVTPFCGLIALFIAPLVARVGFKRIYLIFFGSRKFVTACLLLTPWVLLEFGARTAFLFMLGIVVLFSLCRATAETAFYPWFQEVIPFAVRGRVSGGMTIVSRLASTGAGLLAMYMLGRSGGLERFMVLIAVGVAFGLFAFGSAFRVPGGASVRGSESDRAPWRGMFKALVDPTFARYLLGLGTFLLVGGLWAFLPFYMKEKVGLDLGKIVGLSLATTIAAILPAYPWGWLADRYGSKPVAVASLLLHLLLPLFWILMPRHSPWSIPAALGIAVFQGIISVGWGIGSDRLLNVNVVPPARKTQYMAGFYAWQGLVGGVAPLVAGWALERFKALSGRVSVFTVDQYTPGWIASVILLMVAALLIGTLRVTQQKEHEIPEPAVTEMTLSPAE
jgi:MFS family permease